MFTPENRNMFDSLYFWKTARKHIEHFLDVSQQYSLHFFKLFFQGSIQKTGNTPMPWCIACFLYGSLEESLRKV